MSEAWGKELACLAIHMALCVEERVGGLIALGGGGGGGGSCVKKLFLRVFVVKCIALTDYTVPNS